MSRCGKGYPECNSCVNREFDPFQCDTCEDGSNYEYQEDPEEMTIREFIDWMKEAA